MVLQKKKHPKYRKPKTKDEKKQLKRAIKLKEKQSLDEILYKLPKDLKVYIFQLAIQSNMNEWLLTHQRGMPSTLSFINTTKGYIPRNDKHSSWLINTDTLSFSNEYQYWYRQKCIRNVKKRDQSGIISLSIPDNLYEEIDSRMWSNIPDVYWYHNDCRCSKCDKVRIIGYRNLSSYEKCKFSHIEWPVWSDQWNSKSLNQVRYEKNNLRNKKECNLNK